MLLGRHHVVVTVTVIVTVTVAVTVVVVVSFVDDIQYSLLLLLFSIIKHIDISTVRMPRMITFQTEIHPDVKQLLIQRFFNLPYALL